MRRGLFIGTSGWSYKEDWAKIFYYSRTTLLQQYFTYFDTAEINSTFYSLPSMRVVEALKNFQPPDKFYTAKLPRIITHDNRLDITGDAGGILEQFFQLLRPLSERIEALLIQLPPWEIESMASLEEFLSGLDNSFRYAIEFRDESWLTQRTYKLLEDYSIAYCVVDEPKLPIDVRVTTNFSYVRWHGHGSNPWYNYKYSIEELEQWVPLLEFLQEHSETVLGYFNNHFFGYAPFNALQMMQLMGMLTPVQTDKLERMKRAFSQHQSTLDGF